MKSVLSFLLLSGLLLCTSACKQTTTTVEKAEPSEKEIIKPKYARYFEIEKSKSGERTLRIFNPWKNGTTIQELAVGSKVNKGASGIKSPVESIVPMSTSFYGYLEKLGKLETVSGVEDKKYVYNAYLLAQLNAGKLTEVGQSGNISVERTVVLKPDVIVISGTEILGPNLLKIQQSGIAILNNMDWQEQHPLGRAEWIKVFGLLYNQEEFADSLFNEIEKKYNALCEKVKTQIPSEGTSILRGYNYQGTWFLPGGRSYVAQFLRDAGASYQYSNDTTTGSLPLSSELVFNEFSNAAVWLDPGGCKSIADLLRLDGRYKNLGAFKSGSIYNNTRRSLPAGGNDCLESSPANPDLVLMDLVKILYPQLLPEHKLYFYQRLE